MNEIVQVRMKNWASIIKARQDSGQSVKDWCAANDVSVNAYYYWLRKLRKAAIGLSEDPSDDFPQFVKVPSSAMQPTAGKSLRISRGETVIEVSNDITDHLLQFLKEVMMVC